ncbi:MAG: RagB/SusD family nutrient uptake outer membrane protein, partial [Gemmatimonadetes bacterium]|nr:RagB/SusD family nutrient uptake outer membrane protein [Gemmatimonadota bacterium]
MRRLSSLLLFGCLSVAVAGCDEFLEPEPETFAASTTYFRTPQQVEQAVVGLYAEMRSLHGGAFRTLTDFRSDLVTLQYNVGVPGFTFVVDEFAESVNDNNIQAQWNVVMRAIFNANVILTRSENVVFPNQAEKDRLIAEAKFVRALALWQGLQFWGLGEGWQPANLAIPLPSAEITSPTEAFKLERATVQQVYDRIVEDLTSAKAALPARGSAAVTGANAGRITRGAATFLLGATYQLNPAAAAQALDQFDEVVAAGYSLVPQYRQVFNPANKNNSESILEIQFSGSTGITSGALFQNLVPDQSPLNAAGGGNAGNAQRVAVYGTSGNGLYVPTPDHVMSFTGAKPSDPVATIDERYADGYGAFCPGSGTSGVTGVADVIVSGQGPNTNWPDINIASLRDPQTKATRTNCIAYFTKWRWPEQMTLPGRDNNNWIVFRYADAQLRRAEALSRLGRSAEALAALNQVRARAELPALSGLSGPALSNAILQERAWELAERFRTPDVRIDTGASAGDLRGERFDLAINSTSLGLKPGDPLPLDPHASTLEIGAALDLVYSPGETHWVHEMRVRGIPAADGKEMLIQQGAAAFRHWFGVDAPVEA